MPELKPRFKQVIVGLLVVICISAGLCWSSLPLTFYYRVKYFSGSIPPGLRPVAARRMTGNNPFFFKKYAVLIDMSLSSDDNRLRVYALQSQRVAFATRVMHGKYSGKRCSTRFSNEVGSNCTSLGRYVVVGNYRGKFGKAYRLAGLDSGNSNAMSRSIVIHSSAYVSDSHIGRSEGCPAVSRAALAGMERYLKTGTLIWIYR